VQAWELLGTAHFQEQDWEKAINCFHRALSYTPQSKDSLYGLGQAYTRLGDAEKGREYSKRFGELAKTSSQEHAGNAKAFQDRNYAAHVTALVYSDSARAVKLAGDLPLAQELLLRALKLEPDIVEWLEELQNVAKSRGDLVVAADVGRRLVRVAPKEANHWFNLGGLYSELDLAEKAIDAFQHAIELAPNDERCRRAQSIIDQSR
jgi:tetratricopeptide (TPR) repeat protein